MSVPVIVGGGLAGLSVALALAPRPVIVLARKMASAQTSSELAQGGIASAVGDGDSVELHEQDTLAAGAGLCDRASVRSIVDAGPQAIAQLARWGVSFDRDAGGAYKLGLEGAHSRRRIVHAHGDATGASVMQALVARAKTTPSITLIEEVEVSAINTDDRGVSSVHFFNHRDGKNYSIATRHVVLATGSACALWRHTTVPAASWGHGLVLAARAGAALRDLEFVQFHPTALDSGLDPMPLISEALRGEGAHLVNESGVGFVDELLPRDIVARAIWAEIERGGKVLLDARDVHDFRDHFPTILQACLQGGIDPREEPIPIRPVAHYHMGGIVTDMTGRTNVEGLFACGEAACTGLHGANRLASNSLLEATVMGVRIADYLREHCDEKKGDEKNLPQIEPMESAAVIPSETREAIARVRNLMVAHVGLRRNRQGLEQAIETLEAMKESCPHALAGLMVAQAALARTESRGAHDRSDFPATDPAQAQSLCVMLQGGAIHVGAY